MDVKTKLEYAIKMIEQESGTPECFGSGCNVVPVSLVLGHLKGIHALLDMERTEPQRMSDAEYQVMKDYMLSTYGVCYVTHGDGAVLDPGRVTLIRRESQGQEMHMRLHDFLLPMKLLTMPPRK